MRRRPGLLAGALGLASFACLFLSWFGTSLYVDTRSGEICGDHISFTVVPPGRLRCLAADGATFLSDPVPLVGQLVVAGAALALAAVLLFTFRERLRG